MVHLTVDIGGKPGVNCRGFCTYCYFKHAKDVPPFGCRYCLPFKKGCDYCTRGVKEGYEGFLPLKEVAENFLADLQATSDDVTRITISGGGDPSCYPEFTDLMEILGSLDVPLHIGYTSGKGFDSEDTAEFLLKNHLTEISFTVFASDPALRRKYMNDPTPEASLAVLKRLAEKIDVYAAIVILPGVNDGAVLENTLTWLEEAKVCGVILMRFANERAQGLILDNAPVMEGQKTHTVEEFREIVRTAHKNHPKLRISGTPLYDPLFDSPFAIRRHPELLKKLPEITGKTPVITGSAAAPFIAEILQKKGAKAGAVVPVKKEIACLMTIDDLQDLDKTSLTDTVIIPGRAFVHAREAAEVFGRQVVRGPEMLTADGETSMGMTEEAVLSLEFEGFSALINLINQYGT
ncbi:MAG: methyl coenzyme M reductase-arginine methyltransferase Mmp10 [Methanocorpusculum sp.]|nr:methyl coenzyme M reductase-arginine methyltransferase Mmp10 [Candidatus Methanocorpusculum equi]